MNTALKQDQREARIKLVEEHVRAENTHNLDAIMDTFGHQPTFVLNGVFLDTREGIRALYDGFGFGEQGGFSNLKAEVKQQHVSDEAIIIEMILTGKHTSSWQGIPATGRAFEIPACAIFAFDGEGKLAGERVYFDAALLLKQLGVLA